MKAGFRHTNFLVGLTLLSWLFSAQLLNFPAPALAATSAKFPMGVDVTQVLDQIAGPDGLNFVEELASLNVSWVRLEFKATDPTNLQAYDRVINRLQSRGLRILAVLVAPWESCELDTRNRDVAAFTQWVRTVYLQGCGQNKPGSIHQLGFNELTARYPSIQYWQLWNEPNVCGFLQTDLDACGYGLWRRDDTGGERVNVRYGMQKFGALIATVYAERSNKQVKIVTGGILNAYNCSAQYDPTCNAPGLDNCYALQPWDKYSCDAGTNLFINADAVQEYKRDHKGRLPFDILGLHPYEPAAWSNGYVPPSIYVTQDIQRHVRRFVDNSYPIWITEWGFNLVGQPKDVQACHFPTPSTSVAGCEDNEARLLDSLVEGVNVRPDVNIGNFFWFNLADGDTRLQAGLIDSTKRRRPVWYHLQSAAQSYGQPAQQAYQKEYLQSLVTSAVTPVATGSASAAPVPISTPPASNISPATTPSRPDFMRQLYDILTLALG